LTLIKSISGTRGTIGGRVGYSLTAQDIVESTAAFAHWIIQTTQNPSVVVGRDARISGELISQLVISTLRMMGLKVVDLGLSTTPTVEIAVVQEGTGGGLILTASHNPKEWNALKFLNEKGEFISGEDGQKILEIIAKGEVEYASIDKIGEYQRSVSYIKKHIDLIFSLDQVKLDLVRARKFKIVVDCINSTGAISIVPLLEQMGCEVITLNDALNGRFAHNPEPLPENLTELCHAVREHRADLGIAVDPDVDRIAFICEDGEPFGEEYTLVAVADYILSQEEGNTVSNLSSTQALAKIAKKHQRQYAAAAVGEVHVVKKMKEIGAVIGGEGNGGIIYPRLHYGRDAMVGAALFLSHLAHFGQKASMLRSQYPQYMIVKDKVQLSPNLDMDQLLQRLSQQYASYQQNTEDGLKIFVGEEDWVHLRKSNTEPIIRIYAESYSQTTAEHLVRKIKSDLSELIRGN
jgi:phosphomannomutase